ncbi:MAG: hypothetical protein PHX70_03510 [Clostridium sp.]|nr:hypothetical protein [Clostridium sp.]
MKKNNLIIICLFLIVSVMFSGCTKLNTIQVKLGLKNNDFDYMKNGKVNEIVIQNKRDSGYKFIVTNATAISEIYDILSSAKIADTKSSLNPDYTIYIYENDNSVKKFNYVVGIDKKDGGNFYSNSKNYIITNRLDTQILSQFNDERTPKDFNKIYYTLISECIDKYRASGNNKAIGIDINDDVTVQKYIFSSELDDFEKSLPSNVTVLNNPNDPCDVKETVTTEGFKRGAFKYGGQSYTDSYIYKAIVDFYDNNTKSDKKYYVVGINQNDYWNISISETKSSDF